MESEQHWDQARQVIQTWLKDQKVTPAKLATMAKLQRSVVSRFLSGRPTSTTTAVRLFETIQSTLSFSDRLSLMEAFGLSRFSNLAKIAQDSMLQRVWQLSSPVMFQDELSSLIEGTDLLVKALAISAHQPAEAAQLCFLAEQAYQATPTNSLKAARIGLQMLINLGSYEEASHELARMDVVFSGIVEPRAEVNLLSARGWIEYDRGNLELSIQAFNEQLKLAQKYSLATEPAESHHFIALSYLAMGRSARTHEQAQGYLHLAMQHMEQSNALNEKNGAIDCVLGFGHYRKGQILDAQGYHHESQAEFALAHLLMPIEAAHHIQIHQSEGWLDNGDTPKAKSVAQKALSDCVEQKYAAGLGRAARTFAQSQLQEGKYEAALEYALAAASFDPYSWYGIQMQPINVLIANFGNLVKRQHTKREFDLLLSRLRNKADERQGVFQHLTCIAADRNQHVNNAFALFQTSDS